jgi:hypothetical protein
MQHAAVVMAKLIFVCNIFIKAGFPVRQNTIVESFFQLLQRPTIKANYATEILFM